MTNLNAQAELYVDEHYKFGAKEAELAEFMDHARRVTTASEFARDKIEDIRNTAYTAVASGSDTVTEGGTGATYARTWTSAAGPSANTKLVTVTVSWTARTAHTVSLQTIVTPIP